MDVRGRKEEEREPYRSYAGYLREKYGEKVYRIGVDGGFSCPNRGPGRQGPGCYYCDAAGSRAPYLDRVQDVRDQIARSIPFMRRRYRAENFILYFQAYTSTLAPAAELERIYTEALGQAPFRELVVSTRPDCLPEETVDLLAGYQTEERDVWVELGLQTIREETLRRVNRGHGKEEMTDAFQRLRSRGIKVAVHLILGLPGEDWKEMEETIRYTAALRPEGVKIHNLHIPPEAPLAEEYRRGELAALSSERHMEYAIRALELLPPETVVIRLTCDTPKERGRVPGKNWGKSVFYQRIRDIMVQKKRFQGSCCGSSR